VGRSNYAIVPSSDLIVKTYVMTINLTQAMALLLLSKCIEYPNLGLHLIIFVTDPENKIGFN